MGGREAACRSVVKLGFKGGSDAGGPSRCPSHSRKLQAPARLPRFFSLAQLLAAGENVVLLANHQTEADPGVFAHMLKSTHPSMATDVIYVRHWFGKGMEIGGDA